MFDPTLRRFGYLVRVGQPSPLLAMLERAGLRPHPLNRLRPAAGHWIANCPICGAEDGAYVEPGMVTWTAGCTRGEFGIFELHALVTGTVAA